MRVSSLSLKAPQPVANKVACEIGECSPHLVHSHEDRIDRSARIGLLRSLEYVSHDELIQYEVANLKVPIERIITERVGRCMVRESFVDLFKRSHRKLAVVVK